MWKPKPIKGKDEDFFQPRQLITLAEFLSRSFLEDHPEKILEVTVCHTTSIVEIDNNYDFYEEVDNSNEIKQRTSVFDRIKTLTTQSSVFQRLSMATKEEENQYPTSTYTRTSAFKRLSISTSKKDRPSTSSFDRLKMTNDQQQREMKSLKAKPFHEENGDDKIHSRVPSRMKRKLSVDINTEEVGSLTAVSSLQRTKVSDRSYQDGGSNGKSPIVPKRSWIDDGSITSPKDEGAKSLLPGRWILRAVDLTTKARSSPDRSWIVDGSITSPNDEVPDRSYQGGGSDSKSPIIPR
ncbi:gag protease polyprotein [Cucumis melo var. makuwa]|uniref:Gag protease polyprotein n=1 Tax=Cucumis melo var. makuwa TaxID=1194695 RepID=A0A5A7U9R6_CUCMM|nr:gag protease polyprotein [Cucumis melo var. makuwa]TYK03559.1 gag protease polyprotein [Cucumis melo var. makuwa]